MITRLLIAWQLIVVAILAAGWGCLLWRIAGRPRIRRASFILFGLGGFCLQTLVLQSLVYAGIPLRWSAWPSFAVAVWGVVAGAVRRRARKTGRMNRDALIAAAVAAVVLAIHLAVPAWLGPERYFGRGHYDQANYVVTAQFLVDESFGTPASAIGLHPWLTHPIEKKEERITQSIAHGAVAALSGGDCQQSYAVTTATFLLGCALATLAWLRRCAVPRWAALCGGLLAGAAPGVLRLQLDGFLSQVATLFVVPGLAAALWPRAKPGREAPLLAAVFLAFLIGAYTEIAVIAGGIVAALLAVQRTTLRERVRWFALIVGGALVLNPGYVLRLPDFLLLQWSRARDPLHLATYFPDAGTWAGFGRVFVDSPDAAMAGFAGMLIAVFGLVGIAAQLRRRRVAILGLFAVPLFVLTALRLQTPLAQYPLGKLMIGFTPLWAGAVALLASAPGSSLRWLRMAAGVPLVAMTVAAIGAAVASERALLHTTNTLRVLQSDGLAQMRAEAVQHSERRYLVAHDDPLVAQWLCYFGRRSAVYVDRRHLGDRVVASESFAFRHLPPSTAELWWLDPEQHGRVERHEAALNVEISGELERGETGRARFYLIGDTLQFTLTRPGGEAGVRDAWLDLALTPLQPTPCDVEFASSAGRRQSVRLMRPGWLRFHVPLAPGRNAFTLHVRAQGARHPGEGLALLQAVSIEPVNRQIVTSDPRPADYVD